MCTFKQDKPSTIQCICVKDETPVKLACYAQDGSQVANGIKVVIPYTADVSHFNAMGPTRFSQAWLG